jgi:hypothetical protein
MEFRLNSVSSRKEEVVVEDNLTVVQPSERRQQRL